jgi:Holliday junction resolvase RusA-like endonuclease
MTYRVVITNTKGTYPLKGLNELLGGRMYNFRTKKYHNPVKCENDRLCLMAIRKYMRGVKIDKPIQCTFWIYAQDKRHDRGNLYSACEKSFLDALQQAKVIQNDGFDDVYDSIFHTCVDRHNPHVEVEIEVVE